MRVTDRFAAFVDWLETEPVLVRYLAALAVTVGLHFGVSLDATDTGYVGAVAAAIAAWAARQKVTPWKPPLPTVSALIDETAVEGKRLGRHVLHDARSLGYLARDLVDTTAPVVTKMWQFPGKPLNQGALGSCTGNATTHLLRVLSGKVGNLNESTARKVYARATQLDAIPGSYPPQDTGSDGLSALKAAQQLGLFAGSYRWCVGLNDVLAVLSQHGPVIVGSEWFEGFDDPAPNGRVSISGSVRGGHEYCIVGVDATDRTVRCVNSWGSSWGDHGFFSMTWETLGELLRQRGDAATIG